MGLLFSTVFAVFVATGLSGPAETHHLPAASRDLPTNFDIDPVFRVFVDRMRQSSPTFRSQARRLAVETRLLVRIRPEDLPRQPSSAHARTILSRQHDQLVSALVYLRPSPMAIELIAHELEHIVEQLDGVNLQAQAGNGVVWASGDGAFETRRAIEAGRRVVLETTMGSGATGVRRDPSSDASHPLATVMLRERDAGAFSVRSGRLNADARFLVFISAARLVAPDNNRFRDVYVLDLATGRITLESVAKDGSGAANGESRSVDISGDGRFVVFESEAGNLADNSSSPGDSQVFLRDRETGATSLLSANANGGAANGASRNPVISADGSVVVFESGATDLVAPDAPAPASIGIYAVHLSSGVRTRLDLPSMGGFRTGQGMSPAISADGGIVVFASRADLTCQEPSCVVESPDNNGVADIYVRDLRTNITRRIGRPHAGGDPDGASYDPAISGNGRYVAFVSEASNLLDESGKRGTHVYVHDLGTGLTELISRTASGRRANGASLRPALSHDGSTIAYQSLAPDLLCEASCRTGKVDINLVWDVFVHDRLLRRTVRATADGSDEWPDGGRAPSLDASGSLVAFTSRRPIDARDQAHDEDLYVIRVPSTSPGGSRPR